MRATRSIALRLIVGAVLWISVALTVSGFVLAGLFDDYVERNFDARLEVLLESLIAAAELDVNGRLFLMRPPGEARFDQPFSGWYWQIDRASDAPLRSRSLWDETLRLAPSEDGVNRYPAGGPNGERLRVMQRRVTLPGAEAPFVVAVAADLAELEAEVAPFNATLGWSLGILGLGLLGAVLIQVRFGLQPLHRMRAALADIRAGRRERLDETYPAEINPLAGELNALLRQNADVVERARTHVGNLAHALKTPLSLLNNEAARAEGRLGETVRRQVVVMRRWVDHYLARARAAASGTVLGARTPVAAVIDDLRRTLLRIHVERNLAIEVACDGAPAFRGDRQDLEEMLGNLMDNACKWAESTVHVRARQSGGRIEITVADDGPGLAAEQRAEALTRGGRLDETTGGSGLGLPIVRDIAGLYGGALNLNAAPTGGLKATLALPAAEATD